MAVFTNPATTSPLGALPPELATRILDLLFAGRSPDVPQCRLVCQDLYYLSSPYLIRTVVIAERLETLVKMREVMLHPYFSKHVTHLIWDASYYDSEIATDYSMYENAFRKSEHLAPSRDEDYIRTRQTDAALLKTVESRVPTKARIPVALSGKGHLLAYGIAARTNDEQGIPLSTRWRDRWQSEDVLSMPNIRESKLYRDSADTQDGDHMAGCHLGFADYYRRWENQNKLRDLSWQTEGKHARNYFVEAMTRLPKLRNIAHSDYRALAYNGETYAHLCQRLFGNTVCPLWSNVDRVRANRDDDQDTSQGYHDRFQSFLSDLSNVRQIWDSLSFGRHPFEVCHYDFEQLGSRGLDQKSVELRYDALFPQLGAGRQLKVRHLRLPILTGNQDSVPKHGGLEALVTDNLVELEVGQARFYKYWDRFKKTLPPQQRFGPGDPQQWFWKIFPDACTRSTLQNLHSLSLRGFVFYTDAFRILVLEQLPALRTLHVIDCCCMNDYGHFSNVIQTTIQPANKLHGVEIFGLRFSRRERRTSDYDHILSLEYREKLQERRAHEYQLHREKQEQMEGLLLSDWPYEQPELEAAILGGKANTVSRKMHAAPNDAARWKWQDMPIAQV